MYLIIHGAPSMARSSCGPASRPPGWCSSPRGRDLVPGAVVRMFAVLGLENIVREVCRGGTHADALAAVAAYPAIWAAAAGTVLHPWALISRHRADPRTLRPAPAIETLAALSSVALPAAAMCCPPSSGSPWRRSQLGCSTRCWHCARVDARTAVAAPGRLTADPEPVAASTDPVRVEPTDA